MLPQPNVSDGTPRPAMTLDSISTGPRAGHFQFTIGKGMCVVAAFAVVLSIAPTGLAAVVISFLLGFYYMLYRNVLPGAPLPPCSVGKRRKVSKIQEDLR